MDKILFILSILKNGGKIFTFPKNLQKGILPLGCDAKNINKITPSHLHPLCYPP